jgi:septal ring factor EnvC (AmiA/AmiB activator)
MPKFILSLLFICVTSILWGQESQQEKLEKRKAQIQQEIIENEKLLQSVKKKEKSAISVVVVQASKIKLKEKLINTSEKQAKILSNDIYSNQIEINKLNRELKVLKEDYAVMIVKSYKSRSEESRAMFILSSTSFLQAYKRAQYMKQYTNYRKMQGDEIKVKSDQLVVYNEKMGVKKSEKQQLIQENEKEKTLLVKAKEEQEQLVNDIKKDKNKIATDINKKQLEARAIERQIDRLIREAIAEANRKAALEKAMEKAKAEAKSRDSKEQIKTRAKAIVSTTPVATSSKIVLTPEAKLLSDSFKNNKGKLPWPVEKGFVSSAYGDHPHPVISSLMVHNSGIDITTDEGSSARAVFAGEVTGVIVSSPVSKAVVIQHGEYFTVYQNLSSVYVSKGDKISTKQAIGKIRTNNDTGKTTIKFIISQNTIYNNPSTWLSNM